MQTADAATPQPTYGIFASSKSPWMVPSSPKRPCSTGKATSTRTFRIVPSAAVMRRLFSSASGRSTAVSRLSLQLPSRRDDSSRTSSQRPLLVIPTGMTSYFLRSRPLMTVAAERQEISCSDDMPPKKTATVIFAIKMHLCNLSCPIEYSTVQTALQAAEKRRTVQKLPSSGKKMPCGKCSTRLLLICGKKSCNGAFFAL